MRAIFYFHSNPYSIFPFLLHGRLINNSYGSADSGCGYHGHSGRSAISGPPSILSYPGVFLTNNYISIANFTVNNARLQEGPRPGAETTYSLNIIVYSPDWCLQGCYNLEFLLHTWVWVSTSYLSFDLIIAPRSWKNTRRRDAMDTAPCRRKNRKQYSAVASIIHKVLRNLWSFSLPVLFPEKRSRNAICRHHKQKASELLVQMLFFCNSFTIRITSRVSWPF